MRRQRLRVPREDESLLCEPEPSDWSKSIADNRQLLQETPLSIGGVPLSQLRRIAQSEVAAAAQQYLASQGQPVDLPVPDRLWVATGHQPELYHPGVWIKNFAVASFAKKQDAVSLHVIIDNDTVKSTTVRAPAGKPDDPFLASVPFDRWGGEVPYEDRPILDFDTFSDFSDRLLDEMRHFDFEPLAASLWKHAVRAAKNGANLGEACSHARRALELKWGCQNLEAPLSLLCDTEAFCRLAAELIGSAEQFASIHNAALVEYRKLNGIRSKNHPVPKLASEGGAVEVPFWAWTADNPQRERVFVEHAGAVVRIWAGKNLVTEAPSETEKLVEHLRRGVAPWKLRPRALNTTIFLRLLVSDLFVHGVGGGKYDELTDEIIFRLFKIPPPAFAILSATVQLPTPAVDFDRDRLRELQRMHRDIRWNPDRYLDDRLREMDPASGWIERKFELMAESPGTRTERIQRYREFRQINEELARLLGPISQEIEAELRQLQDRARTAEMLSSREFSYVVHPEDKLRNFFARALHFDPEPIRLPEDVSCGSN